MVTKTLRCPRCGGLTRVEGEPGERIIVVCPSCSTKGVYVFPGETRGYAIQVKGLSKTFGETRAVDNISFNVRKGEVFGFLGPNGAGKTTTIKSILGFIQPDAGEIFINGLNMKRNSRDAKKDIGYLPEKVAFYDNLTAYQNLCFYADMKGVSRESCVSLLKEFGLIDARDEKVGSFSKGMLQRLGMARAVLGNPSILILDEPSNGLDPNGVALVRRKILQLKEDGVTVFLSSHILSEVQAVCDRVAIINRGRIVAIDTIDNLKAKLDLKPVLVIELGEEADGFVDKVESLEGVERVKAYNRRLEVTCSSEAKAKVILVIEENKGGILNIQTREPSLEEIFIRFTEGG